MKIRKNVLYIMSALLSTAGIFYLFLCSVISLGEGLPYAHLTRAAFLLGLAVVCLFLTALSVLAARFPLKNLRDKKLWRCLAAFSVLAVLTLSAIIRILFLDGLPEASLQKYKTYYEIALALSDGSIQGYGGSYGDMIASSPLQMGYSYVLFLAFRIFGAGVRTGQYLNVFFSVASAFLSYKIARIAGGKFSGLIALLFGAFWPAGILTDAVLSPIHAFLPLALLSLWLFLLLMQNRAENIAGASFAVALHIGLGVLLGVGASLSPLSCILLIAFLLLLLPLKNPLPALPLNEIPLAVRALRHGWLRCLMLLFPYLILTGVIASNIELSVDRDISASRIAWSILYDTSEVVSPQGRIAERADSFISDYLSLCGSEQAQIEEYSALLDEQEQYTQTGRETEALTAALDDILYPALLFFALIALFFLLFREGSAAILLAYVYAGTALYVAVSGSEEGSVFAARTILLLASLSVSFFLGETVRRRGDRLRETQALETQKQMAQYQLELREQADERLAQLRQEAYANVFDMEKALQEGHVIMTVSQAYKDHPPQASPKDFAPEQSPSMQDEGTENDDFDWKYTDEELNSMVEADWARVNTYTDNR